jgi:flagellar protein FlgJ
VGEALYTDLNALKSLDTGDKSPEAMRAVAQQFESIFVKMMLDSMRDANTAFSEGNYLNSSETEFYQDMMDNQLSVSLAGGKGMGLADIIYRQLARYNAVREKVGELDQSGLQHRRSKAVSSTQPPHTAVSAEQNATPFDPESPRAFVESLLPVATKVGEAMGVDPKALIAQSALETGWGQFISRDASGRSSNNLFNIKADQRWSGDTVSVQTLEYRDGIAVQEKAKFRAYASVEESFNDYLQFISGSPRYQEALERGNDAEQYVEALHQAGYATDPGYAKKIASILAALPTLR